MSSNLSITSKIENNTWVLSFSLAPGADIPRDIFMFENKGSSLGDYQGVCSLEDYRRFQTYTPGTPIPVFGNKFVKYTDGLMIFSIDVDPAPIRQKILDDVKSFKVSYTTGVTSTVNYTV